MIRSILLLSFLFLVGCSLKKSDGPAYLFAYFKTEDNALYLAYSYDAKKWSALRKEAVLRSELSKNLRDPSIYLDSDGYFHIAWTATDTGFGYTKTKDFKYFEEQRLIPINRGILKSGVRNVWAPEIFWDPKAMNYKVIWSSARKTIPELKARFHGDHEAYFMETKDFKNWSIPQKLLKDSPPFYFIDSYVHFHAGAYYLFLKVESHNRIDGEKDGLAYSSSPHFTGPYKRFSATLPLATRDSEGPSVLRLPEGWMIFYDAGGWRAGAIFSPDLERFWDVSSEVKFPPGYRHGSAIEVPRSLLKALKTQ